MHILGEKASDHEIVYMPTALERHVFVLVNLVASSKALEISMISIELSPNVDFHGYW